MAKSGRSDGGGHGPASRAVLDAAMTEAQLFESVRDHLNAFGWLWYHTRDSRGSNAGFPDIVAVRGPYGEAALLFIELKTEDGKVSADQRVWLSALDGAGGEERTPYGAKVYVWHPSDLSSGEIERVLSL